MALVGAGALVLSLAAAPARAEAGVADTLEVSGTVMVLPEEPAGDPRDGRTVGGGAWLIVDDGTPLPLDEQTLAALFPGREPVSGAGFTGTVGVPQEVADELPAGAGRFAQAELRELVAETADGVDAELPVLEAEIAPISAAVDSGAVRQADVVFASRATGQVAAPGDAEMLALLDRVSDYWIGQSGGVIGGMVDDAVTRIALSDTNACEAHNFAAWDSAARSLGYSGLEGSDPYPSGSRHLIVLVRDPACANVGLGTVGPRLSGGLSWVNLADEDVTEGTQVLAHEIGHNLGFGHANARGCTGSTVDAGTASSGLANPPCEDVQYADLWNVMGIGILGYGGVPAALSVNQRSYLGAASPGMLRTVSAEGGAGQTLTVNALTSGEDPRGLLIEPPAGEPFTVEYRNGAGQDRDMPQSGGRAFVLARGGYQFRAGIGVKVLKSVSGSGVLGEESTVLTRLVGGHRQETLAAGDSITPQGAAATVTVQDVTADAATIRIDFARVLVPQTPRISGTPRVGRTLQARPGSWRPTPVTLKYQWYRGTVRIPGATGSSYTLKAVDRGKRISVRVTGAKTGYPSSVRASTASKPVAAGVLRSVKPRISGTAKAGKRLRARAGAWKPAGVKLSHRWYRDGKRIVGTTKSSYRVKSADRGRRLTVRITGKKPGYTTATKVSAAKRVRR